MCSLVRYSCSVLLLLGFALSVNGQTWQLDSENPPQVSITGTSTLHDWTVTCAEVQQVPQQITLDAGSGGKIDEFGFQVPISGMDGGRGSTMNEKIKKAFQADANPVVAYQQTAPASYTKPDASGNVTITSTGTLTMAGVSKPVEITCKGAIKDGVLTISGSHPLKITDFGMVPPSAMFGQIKTDDDVAVNYEFQYRQP